MKQILFSCILFCCMNSCSYGQDMPIFSRVNPMRAISNDPAIQKLSIALAAIERLYVDSVNSNKLAEDAIIHMLEKLDPHSTYLSADEVKKANEPLQGNFDGIGIQFNMYTDTLYVVEVISNGPSEKIGIRPGDRIIYVDDILIAGVKMKSDDVVSKLKGPKGTTVNVKILRRGHPQLLDFKIVRDKIPVHSLIASYMVDNKTGYIKFGQFSATTHQEFKEALGKLKMQGMENLILDLQGNGGGYLMASIELANEFLNPNSLIVYTEGLNQNREEWKANRNGSFMNGRLVVLVDYASASASEIVAGAVQDWDRGVIIGTRTFGKGMVQRPIGLPDGSMIRLTTAHYYTPAGRSIQKPYTKGDSESYYRELLDRAYNGEMLSADSVHFADSLIYKTLTKNRTVYGGGGIMPDYYVPVDTTDAFYTARTTQFFLDLNNRGIIVYKYVPNLLDDNRDKYKKQYPSFDSFKKNFTVTDKMFNEMLSIYRKEKAEELKETSYQLTEQQLEDYQKSKWLLSHYIKMTIARGVYSDNEFYQLYNTIFDTYNKAIEIINDENEYNELLNQDRKNNNELTFPNLNIYNSVIEVTK